MIGTITAVTTAAAPHVGAAALAGAKSVAAMAVATKATRYAQGQVEYLLDRVETAREAGKEATAQTTDNVTPVTRTA